MSDKKPVWLAVPTAFFLSLIITSGITLVGAMAAHIILWKLPSLEFVEDYLLAARVALAMAFIWTAKLLVDYYFFDR